MSDRYSNLIKLNSAIHKYTGLRVDKKIFISFTQIASDFRLAISLGRIEMASQFGNTTLGSLWQPITLGVTLFGIGVIFGSLFNLDVNVYLPYLTLGMVIWSFIVSSLNESSRIFSNTIAMNIPYHQIILLPIQTMSRNIYMFIFNIPTIAIVLFFCKVDVGIVNLGLALLGMINISILIFAASLLFSLIGSRYRDFPNIIQNSLQILFFITPIMWQIDGVKYSEILSLNPMYIIIEFVRAPILSPDNVSILKFLLSTIFSLSSLCICCLIWCLFSWRIPYHAK